MEWSDLEPRTVTLPQGGLTYRETGSGETILFVHGVLVNGAHWRKVVPHLTGFRCVVPDLPLGAHPVPMDSHADLTPPGLAALIAAFVDSLDLRDVTVVGNDTGGALVQILAVNHPERIKRLVLVNCDAYGNFFPWMIRPMQALGWVPGLTWTTGQALRLRLARRLLAMTVSVTKPDDAVARNYFEHLSKPGVRRDLSKVLRGIRSKYTKDAARKFPQFSRPVLLAWGDKDFLFPRKYALRLAADFPNSTVVDIAGASTFVPEDKPEELAAAIRQFCEANPLA